MREAHKRGDTLGLSEDELAFYDALANNQSAVEVTGDEQLAFIARELIQAVRKNVSIDWTVKQGARARIRVVVKRILRHTGTHRTCRKRRRGRYWRRRSYWRRIGRGRAHSAGHRRE